MITWIIVKLWINPVCCSSHLNQCGFAAFIIDKKLQFAIHLCIVAADFSNMHAYRLLLVSMVILSFLCHWLSLPKVITGLLCWNVTVLWTLKPQLLPSGTCRGGVQICLAIVNLIKEFIPWYDAMNFHSSWDISWNHRYKIM